MASTLQAYLTSGHQAEWHGSRDIFRSSSETLDQYDKWIQAPAKRQTFVRIGRAFFPDQTGLYLLPRSVGEDSTIAAELAQWQDAAVDAFWVFEATLGGGEP
jgi:hypothetical protein